VATKAFLIDRVLTPQFTITPFIGWDAVLSASIVLLVLGVGLAMILNNALVNARLQELIPDAVRGRVLSVYVMVYVGSSPIGSALGGWVARAAGVSWAIGGGGALMLLVALWAFRRHPGLATH